MINPINNSTKQIHFLLGSNIGDRLNMLKLATNHLKDEFEITHKSAIYESEAWGNENQAKFLNQAISANTNLSAEEVLIHIKMIEEKLGRRKSNRWFPRCIDIDIIFYGEEVIELPHLIIPHKHFHQRKFALLPFEELIPNFVHPKLNKTIGQLVIECNDELQVEKLNH